MSNGVFHLSGKKAQSRDGRIVFAGEVAVMLVRIAAGASA